MPRGIWIYRVVEDSDTGKFGNRFLEKLQPLPAQFSIEQSNAGDIAAWPCKTFNVAGVYRISALAHHNDGNGAGRIHGCPDLRVSSGNHDNIDVEPDQLGRKLRRAIDLPLCVSVLRSNVLSFDVAKSVKRLADRVGAGGLTRWTTVR